MGLIHNMQINRFFIRVATLIFLATSLKAQLVSSNFGQNRIQYDHFKWLRYESPSFVFSFTAENEDLMKFLVPTAETSYIELKTILEYQVRQKIEIIVYTDFSDFAQSNVGLESPAINTGGSTKLLDNKILVYFDGNHTNLEKLLREGIARCLVNRMLFGNNLQEIVQNSVLLNLPNWYTEGLIAYCTEEWNTTADDELREIIFSKKYSNYLEFAEQNPILAGRSLFHYISRNHGTASISNLLYLTRINRSVESGFLYVFGSSFYTIAGTNWFNYFTNRYNEDNKNCFFPNAGEIDAIQKKNAFVKEIALSPNGKYIAHSEHYQGEHWLILTEVETQKSKKVWKSGLKDLTEDIDDNYPLIAWKKNSTELVVIFEKDDKVFIANLNAENSDAKLQSRQIKGVERVLSVSALSGEDLLVTAIKGGYSDVYILKGTEVKAISSDKWDDLNAVAVNFGNGPGIVFASNRPQDKLKTDKSDHPLNAKTDLFYYNLSDKEGKLIRLTNNSLSNELSVQPLGKNEIAYLSDENGISNRYILKLDSIKESFPLDSNEAKILESRIVIETKKDSSTLRLISLKKEIYANTNYSRNIHRQSIGTSKVADLMYRDGQYRIFVRDIKKDRSAVPEKTKYRTIIEREAGLLGSVQKPTTEKKKQKFEKVEVDSTLAKELELVYKEIAEYKIDTSGPTIKKLDDTSKVDIDNYTFQTEFNDVKDPKAIDPAKSKSDTIIKPVILEENENGEIVRKEPSGFDIPVKNITKAVEYNPDRKSKYRNLFKVDDLTFQLDNTPLFWGMDLYLQGKYRFPALGLLMKTGFTDIFEDYRLEMGIRLPVNLNGLEYFLSFEDRKSRLDKKFSLYRRSRTDDYLVTDTLTNEPWRAKGRNIKHMAMAELRYPLTKFASVQGTVSFQADKVALISENRNSLEVPVFSFSQAGLRLEYIYDNTIPLRLNARKGTKARFFADYFQNIETGADSVRFKMKIKNPTMVLGFDARHYISLDNKTVLALRSTAAASFGTMKMLYSLGGMENWMFPRFNETIPLPDAKKFTYQMLAAPLRGFQNNIRNGSNFALINAELRIPVTEYLSRTPPSNVMLRNLQLVAFYDVGTAWQGLSPFSKDNPLNTTTIDPGTGGAVVSPVRVRVNYYRRPIVQGLGFGLRTVFLGYFIRMDYAWGVETGDLQTPMVYLSLGMDF